MDIGIIQYAEIDGIRNIADSAIRGLYDRAVDERRAPWLFTSGGVEDSDSFLSVMKSRDTILFIPHMGGEVMGFVWANDFKARSCSMHFCFYRIARSRLVDLGRACLAYVLNMKDSEGYIIDLVTGITPAWNRAAHGYIRNIGMVILGEMPNACFRAEKGESFPGIVSYCTREVLNHG